MKSSLAVSFPEDYVFSEEYQNKYYLTREILEKLPFLNEKIVYSARDHANGVVSTRRKTGRFIDAFISFL
ncbi:MAG: hypothetical protein ACM3QX_16950 [Syntrophomonadaceae bacterium]